MAQVTLPYTLTAGTPENVNNLVSNLNALVTGVNTIDTAQIAAGAVTSAKLASGAVTGAKVGAQLSYAMASGSQYSGAGSTTITFPSGRFSVAPNLLAKNYENTSLSITAITASDFTYQNVGGANASIVWIAVQMTSSAASG